MEEQSEATREEVIRALRLLALASCQQLQESQTHTDDPYISYVDKVMLRVWEQFDDFSVALLKGYDILNAELATTAPPPQEG